ncbi:hypothetical protein Vadar_031488 [Vaccinium darrowii]|uniref:Uncharacterized protein n=1 Tax=Vaccinium darrowii TaxID=229202 RepID=A0ACB7Y4P2_9ERIC|nr:hypothetical protein Vadar_031488 [Vaccinium darrowii]
MIVGGVALSKSDVQTVSEVVGDDLVVVEMMVVSGSKVSATEFTLQNLCGYTVWAGTLCGNGVAVLGGGGFALAPGTSTQFSAPPGWSGRFWARTGCNFDGSDNGVCVTGDCGGKLQCTGSGVPPATLAEFTIGSGSNTMDYYDVSLVDGYGTTSASEYKPPVAPAIRELQVVNADSVVACKSACAAFGTPEYCCTGACNTPATCPPMNYSELFKKACPDAYSYAYDDVSSTFTCTGADYLITVNLGETGSNSKVADGDLAANLAETTEVAMGDRLDEFCLARRDNNVEANGEGVLRLVDSNDGIGKIAQMEEIDEEQYIAMLAEEGRKGFFFQVNMVFWGVFGSRPLVLV